MAQSIVIYPNPTENIFFIELNSNLKSEGSLKVMNMVGEILDHETIEVTSGLNQWKMDLSSYSSGVYFISIEIDGQSIVKKISKN